MRVPRDPFSAPPRTPTPRQCSANGKPARLGRVSFTYLYNRIVTPYTENPNQLMDTSWTNTFSGPKESFAVAYRLVPEK